MKIRPYEVGDRSAIEAIHEKSGLPDACLPDTESALFMVRQVVEIQKHIAVAAFAKLICEAWLLVDHSVGNPESRWAALQAIADTMEVAAARQGLDECTVWVPKELAETSFAKKLNALGFNHNDEFVSFSKQLRKL